MTATYSLHEVATEMRLYDEMRDPVRWLTKQITTGRIRAGRYGRSWRMTQAQIEAAAEAFTTQPAPKVELHQVGLSAASQRRRLSA